jgi:hypothetical protein
VKKLLCFVFLFCALPLFAANFPIPAGASAASIQSILNQAAAGSGNNVNFAAGNYAITSQITIPCAAGAMNIYGPVVPWPGPYTATLTSGINSWMFSVAPCSTPVSVKYLNFNGNHPNPDGGGAFYFSDGGVSNFTIADNKIWGNSASTAGANNYDSLIWLDGYAPGNTDANDTISWNQFGAAGDCGAIMNIYTYQGGTYDAIGGQCAAIGSHVNLTNLNITNNTITQQEQGMKFYEGGSSAGTVYQYSNVNIVANDISFIHRIFIEAQAAGQNYAHNDIHDPVMPAWGSWGFSTPQSGATNQTDNLMIENSDKGGPGAFEFWGNGLATGNLVQGAWGCAFQWGYFGPSQISGNTVQMPSGCYVNNEENLAGGNAPSVGTNNFSTNVGPVTSTTPTASASATGLITLSDSMPNSTVYYTVDGSAPSVNSTPYCQPFQVASGVTVNALGMWGAANQPKSYPAGYGYLPSPPVSVSYSGPVKSATLVTAPCPSGSITPPAPSTPTLAAAYLAQAQNGNKMLAGHTMQFSVVGVYSDKSTKTVPNAQVAWSTSDPTILTVSPTGRITAMKVGAANVQAKMGNVNSSYWTVTVSAGAISKYPVNQTLPPGTYTVTVGPTGVVTVSQ